VNRMIPSDVDCVVPRRHRDSESSGTHTKAIWDVCVCRVVIDWKRNVV